VKRSRPLARTPFQASPRKPLGRGGRLKKVGKRGQEIQEALREGRAAALARAGGVCERCGCVARTDKPLDVHHAVGRGRAAGWPLLHDADTNLIAVDRWCHAGLTLDPHDRGGPLEGIARKAFESFEAWRSGNG
jgi:hypothetical protein